MFFVFFVLFYFFYFCIQHKKYIFNFLPEKYDDENMMEIQIFLNYFHLVLLLKKKKKSIFKKKSFTFVLFNVLFVIFHRIRKRNHNVCD